MWQLRAELQQRTRGAWERRAVCGPPRGPGAQSQFAAVQTFAGGKAQLWSQTGRRRDLELSDRGPWDSVYLSIRWGPKST